MKKFFYLNSVVSIGRNYVKSCTFWITVNTFYFGAPSHFFCYSPLILEFRITFKDYLKTQNQDLVTQEHVIHIFMSTYIVTRNNAIGLCWLGPSNKNKACTADVVKLAGHAHVLWGTRHYEEDKNMYSFLMKFLKLKNHFFFPKQTA